MKNLFLFIMTTLISNFLVAQDWPNLTKFREENAQLGNPAKGEQRVIFMGNSITAGWLNANSEFFNDNKLINRGIGGQTTPQMLLRFRQDVIDLKPVAVVILAGINDIAGNTGPATTEMIEGNIASMAQLAKANGIQVILCTLLPSNRIPWRNNMNPSEKIKELNHWIKNYGMSHHIPVADYYTILADENDGLPEKYSDDGVHVNKDAYQLMQGVVMPIIKKVRENKS